MLFDDVRARGKKVQEIRTATPGSNNMFQMVTVDVLHVYDGDRLVAYIGDDGQVHVRTLDDFLAKFTPAPD